jgi:hypothetical protein
MRTKIFKQYKDVAETDKLLKQQVFLSSYIDKEYDSIDRMLFFHGIGSGKTCTAITITETIMAKRPIMKTLVILPARLKTNFIDELISETCGFNRYISKEDYKKYTNDQTSIKDKNIIKNNFLKRIEDNYEIMSYERLRNILMKSSDLIETIKEITENKVIIIDEIHNLISSKIEDSVLIKIMEDNKIGKKLKSINSIILRLLTLYTQEQKSTKLFLLTATPVFDNYGQFIELMLVLRPDLLGTIKERTPNEIAKYINYLKGKISFFKLKDRSDYPTVIKENIEIPMSDTQRSLIRSEIKGVIDYDDDDNYNDDGIDDTKGTMFCIGERQIAISAYNITKANKVLSDIHEYAPKLEKLFELLDNPGKHLIYSNFIQYCLNLIAIYLERNGWSNYIKTGIVTNKTFVLWDASLKDDDKQKVKYILNSPENISGEYIKVILGSPSIKEGVSFKHIQHLHQIDPVWNSSAKDQIEGRCIRFKSHEDIPRNHPFLKREVFIHNYILVSQPNDVDAEGKIKMTCESNIYNIIIKKKEQIIKIIDKLLAKISIDYYLWTAEGESPKSHSNSSIISASQEKKDLLELIKGKKEAVLKECPPGKILNPKTNKCVKIDGKVGKKVLEDQQKGIKSKSSDEKKKKKDNKYTDEECLKWKSNKLQNPKTNRKIMEGKAVYNDYKKNCAHIASPPK